jgi:hypothetical protein
MEYVTLYYPLYSGWEFPEYQFLFKEPSKATCWAISRFKRDGLGNVWGHIKYPPFLTYVGCVVMMKSDVQGALKNLTAKSTIEKYFFDKSYSIYQRKTQSYLVVIMFN